MPISWYPGHMHKARKSLGKLLRDTGLVIEVLDARIPAASSNPLLASMRGELPLLRVLNKCDLADANGNAAWQAWYSARADGVCLRNGRNAPLARKLLLAQIQRLAGASGRKSHRPGRIAIVGIPNVGKSTLLNSSIGRKLAATGNTPSITRRQQSARFADEWMLVDTPGLLAPKLEDQNAALLMACVGSIGAAAVDALEVARFLVEILLRQHRQRLLERYRLRDDALSADSIFDSIALSRGLLKKAGRVDCGKAAEVLLRDFRGGRLGAITLEHPPAVQARPS